MFNCILTGQCSFECRWTLALIQPLVQVAFALDNDPANAQMVAWTTTPWTLPSNLSLCVHPELIYVRVRQPLPSLRLYPSGQHPGKASRLSWLK